MTEAFIWLLISLGISLYTYSYKCNDLCNFNLALWQTKPFPFPAWSSRFLCRPTYRSDFVVAQSIPFVCQGVRIPLSSNPIKTSLYLTHHFVFASRSSDNVSSILHILTCILYTVYIERIKSDSQNATSAPKHPCLSDLQSQTVKCLMIPRTVMLLRLMSSVKKKKKIHRLCDSCHDLHQLTLHSG